MLTDTLPEAFVLPQGFGGLGQRKERHCQCRNSYAKTIRCPLCTEQEAYQCSRICQERHVAQAHPGSDAHLENIVSRA